KPAMPDPFGTVRVTRRDPPPGRDAIPHPEEGGYREGIVQPDGDAPFHYLPDAPVEEAALQHTLGSHEPDQVYQYPLGDLIVRSLTARDPYIESVAHPQEFNSFERAVLETSRLEL